MAGLTSWGWDPEWEAAGQTPHEPGLVPGRVTSVHRHKCLIRMNDAERTGEVTGRFRHEAKSLAEYPAVGDWVMAEVASPELALISRVLPRRTVLSRQAAGETLQEQVLVANVDAVFIITAFDDDFNVRRIERYVTMARQASMTPVVLVNKSDLEEKEDARVKEAREITPGGLVHRVCAQSGEGLESVRMLLRENKTGVFLGSSGVGKSTLLNALLGAAVQKTQTVRLSDGKGRHTTTARQMFLLPDGGLVIDTPGLREIQLWAEASILSDVFAEITLLAGRCQFANCQHGAEPRCAVKEALESGALSPDRFAGFMKLQKELAFLERKQDPVQLANTKRRWKTIHKALRAQEKEKYQTEE